MLTSAVQVVRTLNPNAAAVFLELVVPTIDERSGLRDGYRY
jgi:hypothetical protein